MATIISIKAAVTPVIPPPYAYDAEVQIEENGERLFIHINMQMNSYYTVAKESVFDFMTGKTDECAEPTILEEYEDFDDTKKSKYAKYFQIADRIIDDLIDN